MPAWWSSRILRRSSDVASPCLAQLRVTLHLANRHARCPHAMEKVEPGLIGLGIAPVTVARASYRLNQPHALIVAKRVRGHSAPLCHAPYGVSRVSHNITVHLKARSKSRASRIKHASAARAQVIGRLQTSDHWGMPYLQHESDHFCVRFSTVPADVSRRSRGSAHRAPRAEFPSAPRFLPEPANWSAAGTTAACSRATPASTARPMHFAAPAASAAIAIWSWSHAGAVLVLQRTGAPIPHRHAGGGREPHFCRRTGLAARKRRRSNRPGQPRVPRTARGIHRRAPRNVERRHRRRVVPVTVPKSANKSPAPQ